MELIQFCQVHLADAQALALAHYEAERASVPCLPQITPPVVPARLYDHGMSIAAMEDGKLVGFLCCTPPRPNVFTTTATGVYTPLHAHGAVLQHRDTLYPRMYQAAAAQWAQAGCTSHSIALYAHDQVTQQAFYTYGFGMRCVDAVRPMEPIDCMTLSDYPVVELQPGQVAQVAPLRRLLAQHLGESPCFMKNTLEQTAQWLANAETRNSRIFTAQCQGLPVAFLELTDEGENFATDDPSMPNICGAFCLPEHRGKGIMPHLLNRAIVTLKAEGYTRLGVDFESFNPTALRFWSKFFTAYTHSVVRRIDESALG